MPTITELCPMRNLATVNRVVHRLNSCSLAGGTISLEEFADWYLHHAPARNMST